MELPSTVFVALGAIVAAIITGIISFINLVAAKDQKTSEFRQEWIDELRSDISNYLANVNIISCEAHLSYQLQDGKGITEEHLKEFAEKVSSQMNKAIQLFHSIQLKLNVKDDKQLLSTFEEMNKLFDTALNDMHDTKKIEVITNSIIEQSQVLLKSEWKRVKRGEVSFFITKYLVGLIVLCSFVVLGAYVNDYFDILITFKNA
ncbi:hypothetical protein GNP73_19725 [Aliivibrio fischeri]|uniref:hypothetical protein n=1 Tax=Aliivibrio fischeri TaxID=668 RepID=UPI0012DA17B3|nr:hypothetical protein [Aliivibrio fischeri]MUJ30189.1 hypothetical protein [Aliivibrio fischeri]